ncbi:MAG: TerB family tellurite resistance protein [Bacteroidales bacterium]|jgi:uncharacterized tellurite resistance protein B-like protein|nr:TerB family tellurite resistance protein [Bacteroidales bacterium]
MEKIDFNYLLLKTGFSCMACDGDIDKQEIALLESLHNDKKLFGDINLKESLTGLVEAISENSNSFFYDYFSELSASSLTEDEELQLIEVAIETIKADLKIEYSEIKFFKIIRGYLKIDNDSILAKHPDFEEYLEQDIIGSDYLHNHQSDYINTQVFSGFDKMDFISD